MQNKNGHSGADLGDADVLPGYVDQVTAVNVTALGLGPSVATVNSYLGMSMAQQRLFHAAVDQQGHGAMTALGLATEAARRILDIET
jgi:hypothetical protein